MVDYAANLKWRRVAGVLMGDTIAAIATAPGHGGIGVIRLSGPDALAIGSNLAAEAL